MVKGCRHPGYGAVTFITLCCRLNVCRGFACGGSAVMAGCTGASDTGVVKTNIQPAIRDVTVIAGVTAGDMSGRFAGGNRSVVTAGAGAVDGTVIDAHYR